MPFDLAIKNATLVEPTGRHRANLYVDEGRIAAIGLLDSPADRTIDASGLFLMPGMVDGHVHFMDPAATEREDFITGSSTPTPGRCSARTRSARRRLTWPIARWSTTD